jgi:hypothetical protein
MSNWNYQDVYEDRNAGFCIRKCISRYGDSHSAATGINITEDARPVGVHFLTKGSIRVLNADGDHRMYVEVGEKIAAPSLDDAQKGWGIFISKAITEYYCIADIPPYERYWTGELTTLAPNESATISGVQNKRVFLPKAANVDGIDYPKHTVLRVDSKDSITVTNAGVTNVIATFWLDE